MQQVTAPTVLGIVGLTGGAGASCLAVALAVRAGRAGLRVLLVDGHPYAGGLDLLVGDDLTSGLGWPDLAGARGALDVEALWLRMAHLGGCAVLSWDRLPPPVPAASSDAVVWAQLAQAADLTVVDLPGRAASAWPEWVSRCTQVLGVHRGDVAGVAAAMVAVDDLMATLRGPDLVGVVVRGAGKVPRQAIARAVGVPVLGVLGDDPSIDAALTRGATVGTGDGALAEVADSLLTDHVLTVLRGAA